MYHCDLKIFQSNDMSVKLTSLLAPDLEISKVITGLWQIADMERKARILDPGMTAKFLLPYVRAGFKTFDMADHYGSSEIIAGKFKNQFAKVHDQVLLFTKWVPVPGKISRQDVRTAIHLSLERMQQTSIDLLQFHAWHYPDPQWLDGLFYLKELQDEGLIKYLGVTNFDAAHLRIALSSGIPIISNQVCHSLIDRRAGGYMMRQVCEEFGVKILAYGTLAGGFLSDKWLGKKQPGDSALTTWSQMKYKRFIDTAGGWDVFQNLLEVAHQIAQKYEVSIANVATRFILENPVVAAVIIGARLGESDHIADNRQMLSLEFHQEDFELIEKAQQELTPIPGGCGDEYRKPPFLTATGDLSHHLDHIPQAYEPIVVGENRAKVFSGTPWEDLASYCRATRVGNRILVSGTTATHGSQLIGGKDVAAQTHFVIDKIEGAIQSLGGTLSDVIQTRIFAQNIGDWELIARVHGQRFKDINPINTLVGARLVGDEYLVEMEAEAVLR